MSWPRALAFSAAVVVIVTFVVVVYAGNVASINDDLPAAEPGVRAQARGLQVSDAPDRSRTPRHRNVLPPPRTAVRQGPGYWTGSGPAVDQAAAFVRRFQAALEDPSVDACGFTARAYGDMMRREAAFEHRSCEDELARTVSLETGRATLLLPVVHAGGYVSGDGAAVFVRLGPVTTAQRRRTPWGTTLEVGRSARGGWAIDSLTYE